MKIKVPKELILKKEKKHEEMKNNESQNKKAERLRQIENMMSEKQKREDIDLTPDINDIVAPSASKFKK